MRGCGLRIDESFAVKKSCFRDGGTVLRVFEQASRDGKKTMPLKHRKAGNTGISRFPRICGTWSRTCPTATFSWWTVSCRYIAPYRPPFNRLARKAGIPEGFTPHSLRHAFVSALLSRGVPITDVAMWLGHRNINVTYATYGHLVPSCLGRAQEVLNAEYAQWSKAV